MAEELGDGEGQDEEQQAETGSNPIPFKRHDWGAVKESYVQGLLNSDGEQVWPNMREIAELHSVPYSKLRQRKATEGWEDDRVAYQGHVYRVQRERRAEHLAKQAIDFDAKTLSGSKVGVLLVNARLSEISEALKARREEVKRAVETGVALPPQRGGGWLDANELNALARSMSSFQEIGRRSLGEVDTVIEVAGPGGQPIDIREELTWSSDDHIGRVLGILDQADQLTAGEPGSGAAEAADSEAPLGD